MKVFKLTIFLSLLSTSNILAQLTIGSNNVKMGSGTIISTDANISLNSTLRSFGESEWHLVGGNQSVMTPNGIANFHRLFIENGGSKTFNGDYQIADQLHLSDGLLVVSSGNFVLANPAVVQGGHSTSSYVDGMLQIAMESSNSATFPVGNNGTYTPVDLTNIGGSDPIIGIDASNTSVENIGGTIIVPELVDGVSDNWTWELAVFNGSLSQANISFPFTEDDKQQFGSDDYNPIVLYQNREGNTFNLDNASGNASNTDPIITAAELGNEGYYFAGRTLAKPLIVHNLLTPNGDNVNDYLVIDNLNFFPDNEVMIVDRYGVAVYSKTNYVSPTAGSADGEDFTFLPAGNYICILKYDNGESTIKQTISVIK